MYTNLFVPAVTASSTVTVPGPPTGGVVVVGAVESVSLRRVVVVGVVVVVVGVVVVDVVVGVVGVVVVPLPPDTSALSTFTVGLTPLALRPVTVNVTVCVPDTNTGVVNTALND